MASNIGRWTRRITRPAIGYGVTLWHYVDSEIEDRSVTRCGRQMKQVTAGGSLEFRNSPGKFATCTKC